MSVKQGKVTCSQCFFARNELCALNQDDGPCSTYRPHHPDGLRPPQQLRFLFRQERLTRSAWQFPDAERQAELHATAAR